VPDDAITVTVPADGVVALRQFAGRAVSVRLVRKLRSLDQNAYWWAVPVAIIADYCGYEPEQMHYALLGEWRGYDDGPVGPPVPRCTSSSKLTTGEFTELIEWVQRWAATELDLQIPSPGEWERTHGD
jgi:hypothetical protein